MSKRGTCCVVDSIECLAAPSSEENAGPVGECFGCGDDVCIACSRRVVWHDYGRKRVCVNCIENEKPMTAKPTRPRVFIDEPRNYVWIVEYSRPDGWWPIAGASFDEERDAKLFSFDCSCDREHRVVRYVRAERGK